jgi:NADH-quinone oxidoreductase B subunit
VKLVLNWGRKYSLWVFNFGLACCAIEFIAASMARHDFIRLGVIPFAPGPRQADLMVVSGTVSDKMAPAVKRLYEQMPEPKYVISFGSCANCGGPYWDSYCVTKGIDQLIPVDVYVPGCPPRPEALLQGIIRLQEKIAREGAPVTVKPVALPKPPKEPKAAKPVKEKAPKPVKVARPVKEKRPAKVESAAEAPMQVIAPTPVAERPTQVIPPLPPAPPRPAPVPIAETPTEPLPPRPVADTPTEVIPPKATAVNAPTEALPPRPVAETPTEVIPPLPTGADAPTSALPRPPLAEPPTRVNVPIRYAPPIAPEPPVPHVDEKQPTQELPIVPAGEESAVERTAELPPIRKRPPRRRYFRELRKARDHGMDLFDEAADDQAWEHGDDR